MEERYMKTKKIIIITMCTLICIMAVGYAAFATQLTINGTANIESTWKVEFTNIAEGLKTSGVTIKNPPTAKGTTATFDVDLTSPGNYIIYKITVTNNGTLNAIINDITASETGSDAIKFVIAGIKKGDKLASKASTTFNILINYNNSVTSQPTITNNKLTVDINYVQDVGQTITSEDVEVVTTVLGPRILKDNTVRDNINTTFTAGLYEVNQDTENNKKTYVFSGPVVNNYVSFAGLTWRIVRINEDGSIRIILNESAGRTPFNTKPTTYYFNPLVGYMYGTLGSTSISSAHANVNSSTAKTYLDDWYVTNLSSYSSYIADAGFCGDRTYTSGTPLGNFAATYAQSTTLACPQESDLYTTTTSTNGNKALTYPIGLISSSEFNYTRKAGNTFLPLTSTDGFWTMTPSKYDNAPYVEGIYRGGLQDVEVSSTIYSVLPVISLKDNVLISSGNGSSTNPYVIQTN